jgi:hypothetical protein
MNYHHEMTTEDPLDPKNILWKNVQSLMQAKYGQDNLWQFCKFVGIGHGTGSRIKEQRTAVGIDTLEAIAAKFDLQVWHLLLPNLDPKNPPVVLISDVEQKFYQSMKEGAKSFSAIEQNILEVVDQRGENLGRRVTDKRVSESGAD